MAGPAPKLWKPVEPAPQPADLWMDGAFRVDDAAELYGLPRTMLFELMAEGAIEWCHAGRARLIARRSLANWLAARAANNGGA